jgi:hypothetical protein
MQTYIPTYARMHARKHARTHAHTHARTHARGDVDVRELLSIVADDALHDVRAAGLLLPGEEHPQEQLVAVHAGAVRVRLLRVAHERLRRHRFQVEAVLHRRRRPSSSNSSATAATAGAVSVGQWLLQHQPRRVRRRRLHLHAVPRQAHVVALHPVPALFQHRLLGIFFVIFVKSNAEPDCELN